MRQLLNQYLFRLIRYLHKKTETQLQGLKKEKKHGTPEYVKAAGQERKLRDLKKALQAKLADSQSKKFPSQRNIAKKY
jgi:hypothetical protein